MVGLVALVLVYFGAAIVMWAWGPVGLLPLGICVIALLGVALRVVRRSRRS